MRLGQIARILRGRQTLRHHEGWSRAELESHQARALAALRGFAVERSRFYKQFHRGYEHAPLSELPVLTKAMLMDHFDELVTDPVLRLADIERYLHALHDDELFAERYWISATPGSSGRRSVIPSDASEWSSIISSYARANEWSGIRISPLSRTRMAIVSSRAPFHQSLRVGRTIESPMVRTLRIDAAQPLDEIRRQLDDFQPEVLVAYASMLKLLAEEQLAGRLHVSPGFVNCSSEVLTTEARARTTQAWRVPPFEVYAATETGGIAAECERHLGLHLFEDLVVAEVVDDDYRPVPAGVTGSRLLVTVLFSRSIPLIRYELTDRVRLATHACTCGRPFRLVEAIEGRTDDVMELPAEGGGIVRIHPVVFHGALELLHASGWQVRQEEAGVRVLVHEPEPPFDGSRLASAIGQSLRSAGAAPIAIEVESVASIPAGAGGKRPLVVARRSPALAGGPRNGGRAT
jgi:phenylacetate-CoA ligase